MRSKKFLHYSIRESLGYKGSKKSDSQILAEWKKRIGSTCKPCWELKYCPYGTLVEQFPLLPVLQDEAREHNLFLRKCLETGRLADGSRLDVRRREWFKKDVRLFDSKSYPQSIPKVLTDAECRVFGYICPVYTVAELFPETKERRTHARVISRDVILKVVRRDGQICQKCHEPVRDDEVEFDHIIPFSKGGNSSSDNLRLVHRNCNRKRGVSLSELLSDDPVRDHYPFFMEQQMRPLLKQLKKKGKVSFAQIRRILKNSD